MEYPTSQTRFLSDKFLLPIFLTSRNQIRLNRLGEIKYYIAKKAKSYTSCTKEKIEDEEKVKIINATGEKEEILINPLKYRQKQRAEKSWKLAPNRYGIPQEIGTKRKGLKGVLWEQTKPKRKHTKVKSAITFYEIPRESEKFERNCHKFKGNFLTNPRKRKPTTRFMVSNLFTCWRNPKEPGPTRYFTGIFNRKMCQKHKSKTVLSYKFLRYSCVAEKKNAAHASKTSFDPGPGRYDLFDDEDAFRFALLTADQKRLKFRHLPYNHILVDKHNSHLWRHIFGFGFTRLFQGPLLHPSIAVTKKRTHKNTRVTHLFHTLEYIKMITCPERTPLSIREEPIRRKLKPMHFNCIVRVLVRRQLRNKKIAFSSGTPRFPDLHMKPSKKVITRQLVNHPIMRVPTSEIRPRLHVVPHRLQAIFKENHIRPFKFHPLPSIRLLADNSEVRPENSDSIEFFPRQFSANNFLKTYR